MEKQLNLLHRYIVLFNQKSSQKLLMSGWFSKVDLLEAAVASQFCCQTNSIGMAAWDVNKCKAK